MITPSKRHIGFIVLTILLISQGIKFDDFCFDDTNYFFIGALVVVFIINFLVVTFYNLYHVSIKKEFFDFFPLVSLFVFAAIFYVATVYPALDFYKIKTQQFENQNNEHKKVILKLFDDATFVYQEKVKDQQCIYKGAYKFEKNQLLLNFKSENFNKVESILNADNYIVIKNDTLFKSNFVKKLKKN